MEIENDTAFEKETNKIKYLLYFEPSPELQNLIQKEENIHLPTSGLHTTLCVWNMNTGKEQNLIEDMSSIALPPFNVKTTEYDNFDNDSLVLKLSKPKELQNLHTKIIQIVEKYTDEEFKKIYLPYFGERYNPHLTISKSSSNFSFPKELLDQEYLVQTFCLAKKLEEGYHKTQEFHLTA